MILQNSILNNCDILLNKSNKSFFFYRKKFNKSIKCNNFFRGSISRHINYFNNNNNLNNKKKIILIKCYKSYYNLSRYINLYKDGSYIYFFENNSFLFKNKINLKFNIIYGPGYKFNKFKKIKKFFINII